MLTLIRTSVRADGAFGVLQHDGREFAVTLERTYSNGGPGVAYSVKIPVGTWTCKRTRFIKGGYETFEVFVPGHSRILFHKGNLDEHSDGCILVAESFAMFGTRYGIADAAAGLGELLQRMQGVDEFQLHVREAL